MYGRRDFLRHAGAVGLALASKPLLSVPRGSQPPNILLIVTDQSRSPIWYPPGFGNLVPARRRLAMQGVSFDDFYVNSIPCSPNRATMMTGLHAHQHWLLDNVQGTGNFLQLDPAFPTIGSILRERGYRTFYFGKWHLTNRHRWVGVAPEEALQPYGFDSWRPQDGPVATDYEGKPNEGYQKDEMLTDAIVDWLGSPDADSRNHGNWLAVASLINPHDISYYPGFTADLIAVLKATGQWQDYGVTLPPNYESLEQLMSNKPACQAQVAMHWSTFVGPITQFSGPNSWTELLNYYLWLESRVDAQVGRIVQALEQRPRVLADTVVIYVSDHGELGGSHGLQGKVTSSYQELTHIPCIFVDHTGRFMPPTRAGAHQSGFASSIDLVPTMLELAGVSDSDYPYLPGASLVPALSDPLAPGAPFVLSSVDYYVDAADAPGRALHYHDPHWKISVYSDWIPGTDVPDPDAEEGELYDLTTQGGRRELLNVAAIAPEYSQLRDSLVGTYRTEMAAPLPPPLDAVQSAARARYLEMHPADASLRGDNIAQHEPDMPLEPGGAMP